MHSTLLLLKKMSASCVVSTNDRRQKLARLAEKANDFSFSEAADGLISDASIFFDLYGFVFLFHDGFKLCTWKIVMLRRAPQRERKTSY